MTQPNEPSHPPSDPRLSLSRGRIASFAPDDRPVRAQLVGGLLLGLLLLAAGLYLWHRPQAKDGGTGDSESGSVLKDLLGDGGAAPAHLVASDAGATDPRVTVSEARILGCHDRGPKRTAPDACDHVAALEHALAHAVEQSAECISPASPSGTIEYVADVSFSRHKVRITLPRDGRSVRDRKVVAACAAAVREAIQGVGLDGVVHEHARYEIAVTASYRGRG